jgi:hypothetical protein
MTSRVLSFLRHRRNLFIFVFVVAAVAIGGTPPVRARLSEAITAHVPFMKAQRSAILDPDALNTGAESANRGAGAAHRSGPGASASAGAVQPLSTSNRNSGGPRLGLSELVGPPSMSELPDAAVESSDGLLKHDGPGGLGAVPSPIAGHGGGYGIGGGSAGGGGGGLPGGFSSPVRSEFPEQPGRSSAPVANGSRAAAANSTSGRANSRGSSTSISVAFDPNAPFASDLTKLGSDDANAEDLLHADQSSAAPLATPEPATLLLVANGVAAVLGSRALRRRRQKNAQEFPKS